MRVTIFVVVLTTALSLAACGQTVTQPKQSSPQTSQQHEKQSAVDAEAKSAGFDQTLSLQGISFHVTCLNVGSVNQLHIATTGLKGDNKPMEQEILGTVTGAEVADLNIDASPEIFVYVTSAGSGSYGSLVAYAVNKGRSLSEIYMPPLEDDPQAAKGYMGHDEFTVVENSLERRFPVYRDKDTNSQPTGGTRQVQYKLKTGEAGWVLKPVRIDNF